MAPAPRPGVSEVLVQVHVAGVIPTDKWLWFVEADLQAALKRAQALVERGK
jgi:hypothetical protein